MNQEIERKFLIKDNSWQENANQGVSIKQAYLHSDSQLTSRIRTKGIKAFITIKGKTTGISRAEFEYEIPYEDALYLFKMCKNASIEKTRYEVKIENHVWEIDVFEGENEGLIVAEIELNSEDEVFEKPSWLGKEVSFENKYFNACLAENPFKNW